jgi:2-dehydropantoate 2-reductase
MPNTLPTPLPKIHIISLGAISKLITYSLLSAQPALPICLILRPTHPALQPPQTAQSLTLSLDDKPLPTSASSNLTVSSLNSLPTESIRHLILPTKSHAALPAVQDLLSAGKFSSSGATILSTQNGLGVLEELCSLFPDPSKFSILAGIINHGVYSTSPFAAVHAGKADMLVGNARKQGKDNALANLIISAPALNASFEEFPQQVLLARLKKLAVNAVINPLTALMNIPNGQLFSGDVYPQVQQAIQGMIDEISQVSRSMLQASSKRDGVDDGWLQASLLSLSPGELAKHVRMVAHATAKNISSMRADVLAGRVTEVDVINGAIVKGGVEHGIQTPVNNAVVKMIKLRENGGPNVKVEDFHESITRHV